MKIPTLLVRSVSLVVILSLGLMARHVFAQSSTLVGQVIVLSRSVEYRRGGTEAWLPIRYETLIGQQDQLRTLDTGKATFTTLTEAIHLEIAPQTIWGVESLVRHTSTGETELTSRLEQGHVLHQVLSTSPSYHAIRVADAEFHMASGNFLIKYDPRSVTAWYLALTAEAVVNVNEQTIPLPLGTGIRIEPDGTPSEVVPAATLKELNDRLDGCEGTLYGYFNRRLPVYEYPNVLSRGVGTLSPSQIKRLFGIDPSGTWYRVRFEDGFGWVLPDEGYVMDSCTPLHIFTEAELQPYPETTREENQIAWEYCVGLRLPPNDWQPHRIAPQQTLYELSFKYPTTAEDLALKNCLAELTLVFENLDILVPRITP